MLSLIAFCALLYLLAGLGVNVGYHRGLSRRSFRLPSWLERSIVLLGLPVGTPIQWAGNHRAHHRWADGWLALGEGWHANHHAYPWSARHGLARGQFDWTWQIVRLLRALGLATQVRTAPETRS